MIVRTGTETPYLHAREYRVLYVLEGKPTLDCVVSRLRMQRGDFAMVHPGDVYRLSDVSRWKVAVFVLPEDMFRPYGAGGWRFAPQHADAVAKDALLARLVERELLIEEAVSSIDTEAIHDIERDVAMEFLNRHRTVFALHPELREDAEELQRVDRLEQYIREHAFERPNLHELAEREFLTVEYLSWKIRDLFGKSFTESIREERIRRALVLLLDPKRSISGISETVGFSAPRYFRSAFEEVTGIRLRDHLALEIAPDVLTSDEGVEELFRDAAEAFRGSDYSDSIDLRKIDLDAEPIGVFRAPSWIDLGDVALLLEEENRRLLEELQSEMHMTDGVLRNVFSPDMDFYADGSFTNFNRVELVLDFLDAVEITPHILLENRPEEAANIEEFRRTFPDVDVMETIGKKQLPFAQSAAYDTMQSACYLAWALAQGDEIVPRFLDEIDRKTVMTNDTFFGGPGLFTASGLKKSSYFTYMFASLMEGEILLRDPGCLVTVKGQLVNILLYSPKDGSALERRPGSLHRRNSFMISGCDADFLVTHFVLDRDHGSVYDAFLKIGSPRRISNAHWDFLDEFIQPGLEFKRYEKRPVFNLTIESADLSVHCITLDFSEIDSLLFA